MFLCENCPPPQPKKESELLVPVGAGGVKWVMESNGADRKKCVINNQMLTSLVAPTCDMT